MLNSLLPKVEKVHTKVKGIPIPKIDEIYAKLEGSTVYSTSDMRSVSDVQNLHHVVARE